MTVVIWSSPAILSMVVVIGPISGISRVTALARDLMA